MSYELLWEPPNGLHTRFSGAVSAEELDRAVARTRAELVIMSRKDLVKLDRLPNAPLVVPDLSIGFSEGEDRVRASVLGAVAAASADSIARISARSARGSA